MNENIHRPVDIRGTKPTGVTCFYKPMKMKTTAVLSVQGLVHQQFSTEVVVVIATVKTCDSKNMQLKASKLTCCQLAANYYIQINNKSVSL